MFGWLKRLLWGKPLTAAPCPKCDAPSFDGVCPSCFQRGEKQWQTK